MSLDRRTSRAIYSSLDAEARRHGLTRATSRAYAILGTWLAQLGYRSPQIVSGRRSAKRQRELRRAWDDGWRIGLVVRPALHSAHTRGEAFDVMRFEGLATMGALAQYLNVRWGGNFTTADVVHFDMGIE